MKTISSIHNEMVQHLIGLKNNSDYRKECKSLLLEGKNAILDVQKKVAVTRLIVTSQTLVPPELSALEILVVSESIMHKLTSVKTSEGIIAELPFPSMQPLDQKKRIVALDRVRDPGNIGTIIRSALALCWDGIFFLPGCCDPFGDKALRSAKGATFHIPLFMGTWEELQKLGASNGHSFFVADMGGSTPSLKKADTKCILILGNEGEGVSIPNSFEYKVLSIPTNTSMESLNVAVAGGILMYLLGHS